MTNNEWIAALEQWKTEVGGEHVPSFGFANPHSWRGSYAELAFEPVVNVSINTMLEHARSAIGESYNGYKGGVYTMSGDTYLHVAEWGQFDPDDALDDAVLHLMKSGVEWPGLFGAGVSDVDELRSAIPEGKRLCPECDGMISYGTIFNQKMCSTCDYRGYVDK